MILSRFMWLELLSKSNILRPILFFYDDHDEKRYFSSNFIAMFLITHVHNNKSFWQIFRYNIYYNLCLWQNAFFEVFAMSYLER